MSPRETIRDGRLADVPVLEALQLRASLIWEEYRKQLAANPGAVIVPVAAITEGRVRVAVCNAEIIGFSLVLPLAGSECELDGLFVDPRFMRRGIGLALLTDVIERARAAGATQIVLVANPRAAPFYEAAGFTAVDVTETELGAAPRMELMLASA